MRKVAEKENFVLLVFFTLIILHNFKKLAVYKKTKTKLPKALFTQNFSENIKPTSTFFECTGLILPTC